MITGHIEILLDFMFERQDSKHVPWQLVEDLSEYPGDYQWNDDIGLFECELWPLPGDHKNIEVGDIIHVIGPATITFFKTDSLDGVDYDSEIDWTDSEITVKIIKFS